MLRIRALVFVLGFAGCSHPQRAQPSAAGAVPPAAPSAAQPTSEPIAQAPVAPAPPPEPVGKRDLAFVPAESEIVAGLDAKTLRSTVLWNKYSKVVLKSASSYLAAMKAACGFDPLDAITSVTTGVRVEPLEGTFIVHGLTKGQVTRCIDKAGTMSADGTGTLKSGNETMVLRFIDDDTLLVVIGPAASVTRLDRIAARENAVTSSPAFLDLFSRIDPNATAWALVNGNAPFMYKVAMTGVKAKAIYGSIGVTDRLTSDVRLRLATADEAQQLASMGKGQAANPQVQQMFDKLDISADGLDARIAIEMTQEQIEALRKVMDSSSSSAPAPVKKDNAKKKAR